MAKYIADGVDAVPLVKGSDGGMNPVFAEEGKLLQGQVDENGRVYNTADLSSTPATAPEVAAAARRPQPQRWQASRCRNAPRLTRLRRTESEAVQHRRLDRRHFQQQQQSERQRANGPGCQRADSRPYRNGGAPTTRKRTAHRRSICARA